MRTHERPWKHRLNSGVAQAWLSTVEAPSGRAGLLKEKNFRGLRGVGNSLLEAEGKHEDSFLETGEGQGGEGRPSGMRQPISSACAGGKKSQPEEGLGAKGVAAAEKRTLRVAAKGF